MSFDTELARLAALPPTANRFLMSSGLGFGYGILPATACDPVRYDPTTQTFSCATYPGGTVSGTVGKHGLFSGTTVIGASTFLAESGTGLTLTGITCLDGGTGCTNGWQPVTTGFTGLRLRT